MRRILLCISEQHDWRLLLLALFICGLSGFAAIYTYRRIGEPGESDRRWLAVAGLMTGYGMWATHFVAVLAYLPGIEPTYELRLTLLSLGVSVAITSLGFWISVSFRSRLSHWIGGGVVGFGLVLTHYLGMAAVQMPATISWSIPIVIASIILGVVLCGAAVATARMHGWLIEFVSALTLNLAVLSHHFTAMGAMTLNFDPSIAAGGVRIESIVLALGVAGAAIAIFGMGVVAALYDYRLFMSAAQHERDRRRLIEQSETSLRLRNLHLDAALNNMSNALVMFDKYERLVVCNERFRNLFNLTPRLASAQTELKDIVDHIVRMDDLKTVDADTYLVPGLAVTNGGVPNNVVREFCDGKTFLVRRQLLADGGCVVTYENITEQTFARRELEQLHAYLTQSKAVAERAAEEARRAHRQIVDTANLLGEGIVLLDAEDRHVLWNQRYAELSGVGAETLFVGARFQDVLRAALKSKYYIDAEGREEEWLAERLARHALPESSFELRMPDGRWVRVDERRTLDGGSIGVRIDITELKRREESLRLLFVSNPLPMIIFEKAQLMIIDVNDAAISHYGWSRAEFLSKTLYDIRPAGDSEKLARIAGAMDGSFLNGSVWKHLKADGEQIDVAIYSRPFEYEGRPAALVAAVDVTDNIRAQAETTAIREFLHSVIENVPSPILVKDAHSLQHLLVNRAAELFLGVCREQVIGKTVDQIYSEQDAACISEQHRMLLQQRKEIISGEHKIETPGNGSRYATAKRIPVFSEEGSPDYILSVFDDTTERRVASERILHLTKHDILTGLPNRTAFGDQLGELLNANGPFGLALLSMDIAQFKEVNDAWGYALGDQVIAAVAHRIACFGGEAFLARVGGDEFNLIIANTDNPASVASSLAEDLLRAFATELVLPFGSVTVRVDIGIAVAPFDGMSTTTLVASAEAALYRAKAEGGGSARFFEAETEKAQRERRVLRQDLQHALERDELRLFFQPQTNVRGQLVGFEALLRWFHPARGWISPGVFIPIAEECGAIVEIGRWALTEACRQASLWPRNLCVAVNLSPAQFRSGDLVELIKSALFEAELPGNCLELEITEGILIRDTAAALSILGQAKELGVRIAMDDFGTGYSSLSYLQSFPFDKIKIDQSFIANVASNANSAAIVRGVLGLARGLALPVIAEGVETAEQVAFLEQEGCDEIQGYFIGRPRPIDEYKPWIDCAGTRVEVQKVA